MSPRDYRLYHYTSYETLKLILAEDGGFWPQYCPEDFSWITDTPFYLVIPMVSFCDIPIILSKEHKDSYGPVVIGLSKDWGKENNVTPLLYVYEEGLLARHIKESVGRCLTKIEIDKSDLGSLWNFVHYLKPVTGCFPDKQSHGDTFKDFDEEMEWRYVPEAFKDAIYSTELFDDKERADAKLRSKNTFKVKLKFNRSDVEVVVVENEKQRNELSQSFEFLHGKISLWSELEILDAEQDD